MKRAMLVSVLALGMVLSRGTVASAEHHRHGGHGWGVAAGALAGLVVLDALLSPRETVVYQPQAVYAPPVVSAPMAPYYATPPAPYYSPTYAAPAMTYPTPYVVQTAPAYYVPPAYYSTAVYGWRPWYAPVYGGWGWGGGYYRGGWYGGGGSSWRGGGGGHGGGGHHR